jgi:beta-galactosidase
MRQIINVNQNWLFTKDVFEQIPTQTTESWEQINLPHTWNAIDGQDGGNDYHRGTCLYAKTIAKQDLPESDKYYLEIRGANSSAEVYFNGEKLAQHDGGYTTWRVDLTDHLKDQNFLVIAVDNAPNQRVYPQVADFTFYGGLYRDVNIVCVNKSHFDLEYNGGPGLMVTPKIDGKDAKVEIQTWITDAKADQTIKYVITDANDVEIASVVTADTKVELEIKDVTLWNGRKNPYLYKATLQLIDGEQVIDEISTRFGCRTYKVDPNLGFILNGEEYPLRGVSRHQDRLGVGNALLPEHHKEDVELICEVGATTIRLAHYQHDQYFYDLCDEKGLVIWAEIPYISQHMPTGRENTISQMKELITQNYNHACIVCWGLSNEITMGGEKDPDLIENHKILNDLAHSMDKTRPTTIAAISMCSMDAPYLQIPDLVSYNHYFGWYGGDTDMNGPWFDKFHATHPNIPIGCSEYGCEALNWHTSTPAQGDYTEEYQAYYHEELIKQLFTRKFMWATHVWNMFDFGADARSEGGENGQNHKGLMTMDRKYKKDAFYAYKAWLSSDPFVHICGKRYVDRVEEVTKVTVYSNLPEVELFVNGESIGKKSVEDHFFYFEVQNIGETELVAVAGECRDESRICKVDKMNPDYILREQGAVLNWFDITEVEGRFSLNDKIGDITKTLRGKLWMMGLFLTMAKKMSGGKSKSADKDKKKKKKKSGNPEMGSGVMNMIGNFTVLRFTGMLGMRNVYFTKEELLKINAKLNRMKKPNK